MRNWSLEFESGNRNKAEALFLLKNHEPRYRKYRDFRCSLDADDARNDTLREMEERFGPNGSKITEEELKAFFGPTPTEYPDWIEDALRDTRIKTWPVVSLVRAPYEFRALPSSFGLLYGLLRYHSLSKDNGGRPQAWVRIPRLAEEAGCSVPWVHRALRTMEQRGYVHIERREGQSSTYTLLLPDRPIGLIFKPGRKNYEIYVNPEAAQAVN
jgi:hypothetical protein